MRTTEALTAHLGMSFPKIISVWPLVGTEATRSQALREPEKDGDSRWSGQEIVGATQAQANG